MDAACSSSSRGFNGYVEELPGEFTLPVSKLRYGVSDLAHKLLRH